jgi:hypothetical protein
MKKEIFAAMPNVLDCRPFRNLTGKYLPDA